MTPTRRRSSAFLLLSALLVSGGGVACKFPGTGSAPSTQSAPDATLTFATDSKAPTSSGDIPSLSPSDPSADPAPARRTGVRMDIWAISVPKGAVSANEPFWKRVDETAVSPQRYELLFVNGFRVGVGRADQWEYFRDLLSRHPAKHQLNAVTAFDETTVEVPVRKGIESQTLGFFGENGLELRTYDKSDNVIALSFLPAPRRDDAARVALTPIVRSLRERLEATEKDGERTLRNVTPERLYDLSLAVEVPFGQFLVISPSTDTARQTSIGRNFLLLDKDAEQSELILLVVPTQVELKPTPPETRPSQKPENSGNLKTR